MNRLHLPFACGRQTLAGTLDMAPGASGLLIVSGGNEVRAGAFNGMAELAARIAQAGFPVFRFDRRGIGDSEGENRGFLHSSKDISAALETFSAMAPCVERVIGFGNCDAASALMLASGSRFDGLLLSNPWTIEDGEGDMPAPPAAIRSRYLEKLRNPREIVRLATGGVNLGKLAKGLRHALRPAPPPSSLAQEMTQALKASGTPFRILLAERDRTAQLFSSRFAWPGADIRTCPGAGHSWAEPHAREWLERQVLAMLRD